MKKLIFIICFFNLSVFASNDRVEEITRDEIGNFNAPILNDEIRCQAKLDSVLDQDLIIQTHPLVLTVVDSDKQYEIFSGARISINAECQGAVSVVSDEPQLQLSCLHKFDPSGRRTAEHNLVIEFKKNGGSVVNQYSASTVTTTRRWKLIRCSPLLKAL